MHAITKQQPEQKVSWLAWRMRGEALSPPNAQAHQMGRLFYIALVVSGQDVIASAGAAWIWKGRIATGDQWGESE